MQTNTELVEKKDIVKEGPIKRAEEYWHMMGPGLTTGASDDDPSGIATYSQAGAQYGFGMLWLALFTFPLMAVVQEMCARIGLVTGRGLAGNIRLHYSGWVLYFCAGSLFIANTFNLGADLGAMAKALQLLFPTVGFALPLFTIATMSLLLQIFTTYASYAKILKWLALILFSYIVTAFLAHVNWANALHDTVIPQLVWSKDWVLLVCAILGTTISPYLFFWQTSQEVEEQILEGKTTVRLRQHQTTDSEIRHMRFDVWSGMLLSNLVMFFIIVTCGAVLFSQGITTITTASDAVLALRPFAGNAAYVLFAFGVLGTGMLAIPVLAGSASYALSESFRWKVGLYRKLREAHGFYGVIIVSVVIGFLLNFIGIDPIRALIYAAVLNCLVAPVVLVLIVRMSGNKKIMGHRVNGPLTTWWGWLITLLMAASGIATVVGWIK